VKRLRVLAHLIAPRHPSRAKDSGLTVGGVLRIRKRKAAFAS